MTDRDREKAHALLEALLGNYVRELTDVEGAALIAQALADERAETWRAAAKMARREADDWSDTHAHYGFKDLAGDFEDRAKETTR